MDLAAQFGSHDAEWLGAMAEVARSGRYVGGNEVKAFETEFAAYCGSKQGVAVANGSDALRLSLLALGIGTGDEVVTVSHTFVSTVDAIVHAGASPVFVDIDPSTFTMDPVRLAEAMGPRVKAVIAVHLYGQSADMAPLLEVCQEAGIPFIEDAAQAHGAEYQGRRCGSVGKIACFSFYPAKNLGALGDGGIVTTDDPDLAESVRSLRQYGTTTDRYRHERVGWNSRLDALQAAVLRRKLRFLDEWNNARRSLAGCYGRGLGAVEGIVVPMEAPGRRHVFHLYCIRTPLRESIRTSLDSAGIETGIHYPIPVHRQPAYARVRFRAGRLPETERAANEVLSLPMYPELGEQSVEYVCEAVRSTFAR